MITKLDAIVKYSLKALKWLVLAIIILLFLQWPLRDLMQGWSREANDLGQWLFALYVAASITQASRAGTHLQSKGFGQRLSPARIICLKRIGLVAGLIPWASFILWSGTPMLLRSIAQAERFPDTSNPFYFMIRLSMCLMALLVLAQGVIDLLRPSNTTSDPSVRNIA